MSEGNLKGDLVASAQTLFRALDELAPWQSVTVSVLTPVKPGQFKDRDGGPWHVCEGKGGDVPTLLQLETDDLFTSSDLYVEWHYEGDLKAAERGLRRALREGECSILKPREIQSLRDMIAGSADRPSPDATTPRRGATANQNAIAAPGAGCQLLDDVRDFIARFLVVPGGADYEVMTVWVAHTYFMSAFDTTPRLAFLSPQPGSGKTLALDLLDLLTNNPTMAMSSSPSSLYRSIQTAKGEMTLLLDEVDTVFQAHNPSAESIRGIVNGGYKRGSSVTRTSTAQQHYKTEKFGIYAPVAMGGLGLLPESLMSRSIVMMMQKPLPTERREAFRRSKVEGEASALRRRLKTWAEHTLDDVHFPELPECLTGRAAEMWEPLVAVAYLASPTWGASIETAAVTSVTGNQGVEHRDNVLLEGIRQVFEEATSPKLSTSDLLRRLKEHEELDVENLTPGSLAAVLKPYGIQPKVLRVGEGTYRGYERAWFEDAWSRYLSKEA